MLKNPPPREAYCPHIHKKYYLAVGVINKRFKLRNHWLKTIRKSVKEIEKFLKYRNLLSDAHQILISMSFVTMQLNTKFHAFPSISFCASMSTKFVSHTHTQRQIFCKSREIVFPKLVNYQKPEGENSRDSKAFFLV